MPSWGFVSGQEQFASGGQSIELDFTLVPQLIPGRNGARWRLRLAFGIPVHFDSILHVLESRHCGQPFIPSLKHILDRPFEEPIVYRIAGD